MQSFRHGREPRPKQENTSKKENFEQESEVTLFSTKELIKMQTEQQIKLISTQQSELMKLKSNYDEQLDFLKYTIQKNQQKLNELEQLLKEY